MLPKSPHDLPGSQPPGSFSALLLPSSGSPPSGKARPLRISLPAHYDVPQTAVPRRKLARLAVLASFLSVLFLGTFVSLRSFSSSASTAAGCDLPALFAKAAFSELADLVIVAGHAGYVGKDYAPRPPQLLAQAMFPDSAVLAGRAFTEERSRDSYENLVFAIARFREITGGDPRSITVVGFEFKRNRFINVHRPSIRWPESR
ncbi:MAG: hypothetical protein BJ554DRAFT_6200 [Olpidium bornovanus]|uniref:DUF218 domain-containing protein n=1 Tax=Olpidium bornovanus TaxID=278681 RepID=A0A8H8DKD8_9FUNG|nr:MAG: hypothetical protein BJ554DRAFT_6200 [Olpidium bornovanus]